MTFSDFVRAQYTALPIPLTAADCTAKTFIVTGANSGLGFECAKHLARMGSARVILAVRNTSSGEQAKSSIEAATGCSRDVVQVWHLDLASYESVAEFSARAGRDLDRIDGLVENAALALSKWTEAEGNETTFTVNVFSTVLMALLMLPHMERTARKYNTLPRIAIVGSAVAFQAQPALERLDGKDVFGDLRNAAKWAPGGTVVSYALSKLLLHLAYIELAKRAPVSKTGVVINLGNPGLCYSRLDKNSTWTFWLQLAILRFFLARSSEVGSRTLLHGLSVGEEAHGRYLSECTVRDEMVPDWVTNEEGKEWQANVWREVEATLAKAQPGCLDVLSSR